MPASTQAVRSDPDAVGTIAPLLAAARRWPLLTGPEEIALAKRIERGDLAARERLLCSNVRLVVSIATRHQGNGVPLPDLVQDGMLGLIRASERFDWRRGFRFSTYATLWIRQSVQRGIENHGRTIRLPVSMCQRVRRITRVERELTSLLGREPSDAEVAAEAELSIELLLAARSYAQPVVSLDVPVGDGEATFGDLLGAGEAHLPWARR